eukprot:493458-Hanusia_phi.AAC.2
MSDFIHLSSPIHMEEDSVVSSVYAVVQSAHKEDEEMLNREATRVFAGLPTGKTCSGYDSLRLYQTWINISDVLSKVKDEERVCLVACFFPSRPPSCPFSPPPPSPPSVPVSQLLTQHLCLLQSH